MLLKFIRVHTKLIFIVILSMMIVPFLFWGIGSIGKDDYSKKDELKVRNRTVPYVEYQRAAADSRLQMLSDFIENSRIQSAEQFEMYSNWFNQLLAQADEKQSVMRQITLENEAKRLGITVTPEEIKMWLENFPLFVSKGSFDIERYNALLTNYFRVAPAQFDKMAERVIAVKKLQKFVMDSCIASSDEIYNAFKEKEEKVSVFYVEFENADYAEAAKNVSEEELKDYYDKHQTELTEPEKIKVCYLLFDPEKFKNKVEEIPQADVESYYESNKDEFKDKDGNVKPFDSVKIEISNKLKAEKAKELCQNFAVEVSSQLTQEKKIADMFNVAKEKGMIVDETDWMTKNQRSLPQIGDIQNFMKTAWQAEINSVSDLVSAGNKWVILSPKEIRPSRVPELSEVKEKIRDILKNTKSQEIAKQTAEEAYKKLPSNIPFAMAVKSLGLKAKKSKPMTRSNEMFTTKTEVVKTKNGAALVSMHRFYPVEKEKWEKEKNNFSKTYLEQKQRRFIQSWLNKLLTA